MSWWTFMIAMFALGIGADIASDAFEAYERVEVARSGVCPCACPAQADGGSP